MMVASKLAMVLIIPDGASNPKIIGQTRAIGRLTTDARLTRDLDSSAEVGRRVRI